MTSFIHKDGSIIPVAYSASPLRNESGDIDGVVVVFRDTTAETAERLRAQRELNALSWLGRIRDALDEDRMVLYSQPIVPLTGGPASEELLVRLHHPVRGDRAARIVPADRRAIRPRGRHRSVGRHQGDRASRHRPPRRSQRLRLDDRQHRPPAAHRAPYPRNRRRPLPARLRDHRNRAHAGSRRRQNVCQRPHDLGCGLALDDFGTGYASFTYLKTLPFTHLKIDIEFVRDLANSAPNRHVVDAIVSLAKGFGQHTIAEGVEDQATLDILKEHGVDYVQGFHLGRPSPISSSTGRRSTFSQRPVLARPGSLHAR